MQSKMLDFNQDLKKLFSSHPKDFAIRGKLAETIIVQSDFTGKMEAWPNFRASHGFASELWPLLSDF